MTSKSDKADIAVALQYDGKNAPRVTAKGEDEIARYIREIAKEHDVPLYEDIILAQVLSRIELGEEIPQALYVTIARVIAFAYIMAEKVCPVPQRQKTRSVDPVPLLTSDKD